MSQARIREAITEYLKFNHLTNTLECFEAESRGRQQGAEREVLSDQAEAANLELRAQISSDFMDAFDHNKRSVLFDLWKKHVPKHLRDGDATIQRLEFRLQVHFAVLPHREQLMSRGDDENAGPSEVDLEAFARQAAKAMIFFRKYLETNGKRFSKNPDYLTFFALPFVPNPTEHPSFKTVFTKRWIIDLRRRLENTLEVVLQNLNVPEIYRAFKALSAKTDEDAWKEHQPNTSLPKNNVSQEKLQEMRQFYLQRESKLTMLSRKIYAMTRQVIDGIKMGDETYFNDNFIQFAESRLQAFTKILGKQGDGDNLTRTAQSNLPNAQNMQEEMAFLGEKGKTQTGSQPTVMPALDYEQIKATAKDLLISIEEGEYVKANEFKVSSILQALRWRMTRTRQSQRRLVLHSYIAGDILECSSPSKQHNKLFDALLACSAPIVVEYTCRLVNCLANEVRGRSYLLTHPRLVQHMIKILKTEDTDSLARQHALGALQKLSLRRSAQHAMIEEDMIKWICDILNMHCVDQNDGGPNALIDYSLEHATALLMHLSLPRKGKIKAEASEINILQVLEKMISSPNARVRSCINGTLYSVLDRISLKKQARYMSFPQLLEGLQSDASATPEDLEQYGFILEILKEEDSDDAETKEKELDEREEDRDAGAASGEEEEEEEQEEDDEDVEEYDDDDMGADEDETLVPPPVSEGKQEDDVVYSVGEDLLCSRFLAANGDAQVAIAEESIIRAAMLDEERERLQSRELHGDKDLLRKEREQMIKKQMHHKEEEANPEVQKGFATHDKIPRTPRGAVSTAGLTGFSQNDSNDYDNNGALNDAVTSETVNDEEKEPSGNQTIENNNTTEAEEVKSNTIDAEFREAFMQNKVKLPRTPPGGW